METFLNKQKEGYIWTMAEAVDTLETNIEFAEVPWLSEENKELAISQHQKMIAETAQGTNNFMKFMKDKEVVACEKEFVYPVELPFKINYKNKTFQKLYIIGSIDCIVKDKNGDLIAIDFKTGKKTFQPKKLRENLQLPIYSLVIQNIYGRLPVQTKYYFTRSDTLQDADPIAQNESQSEKTYFKSGAKKGQLKYKQRTVDDVISELIAIFKLQYATGEKAYKPNPNVLCSWCPHGAYSRADCDHAMFFERKDLPYPKRKGKNARH